MSIIDNLQNSTRTQLTSNANVNINLGDGHSTIRVTGKDVNIDTGCGDQDIEVKCSGDLNIDTGFCGEDKITALVGGNATVVTREDNDTINMFVNGNFAVDAGMVDPKCGAEEDDDKITIVSNSTSGQNYVAVGQGNDTVNLIANNVDVKKNEGTLELGFIGNNYNINSDANGQKDGVSNFIAGWGDNVTMNLSTDHAASNKIYTFDQLWSDSDSSINTKFTTGFWQDTNSSMLTSLTLGNGQEINFVNAMDNIIESYQQTETSTSVTDEVTDSRTTTTSRTDKIGSETVTTQGSTELVDSKEETTYTTEITVSGGTTLADIAKKYKIPESELNKYDLNAKLPDGSPKYTILGRCNGSFYQLVERQTNSKGNYNNKVKVLATATNTPNNYKKANGFKVGATVTVSANKYNGETTSGTVTQTTTTTATTTRTDTYATHYTDTTTDTYRTTYTDTTTDSHKETTTTTTEEALYRKFDGVANWQVNTGDGKLTGHVTARGGYINFSGGEACNNDQVRDLRVDSGYITRDVLSSCTSSTERLYDVVSQAQRCETSQQTHSSERTETSQQVSRTQSQTQSQTQISSAFDMLLAKIASPLILDMNHDGQVSATAGMGVDVNGDGKVDGAATGGDKMLAMTDINGNGSIDGAEVFGDKTVSPFTKQPINAKNGFEALKTIAQQAKQYTGIDCMSGSQVDVKKLQQALAKVGVKLGFISDGNNLTVEDLYGVSKIEVGKYTANDYDAAASVQNQISGEFTDENGVTYRVDDVWFRTDL